MADLITAAEYISIDTVNLATPAYRALDTFVLLEAASMAGDDTIMPGTHGSRPNPRWRRPTQHVLEIHIFGERTSANAANTNPRLGLAANLATIRALCDPPGSADGTRTLTYHFPGGTTMTAAVHVQGLTTAAKSPTWRIGALELSLPQGRLT